MDTYVSNTVTNKQFSSSQWRSQTTNAATRSTILAPSTLRPARAAPLTVGFSADPDASASALVTVTVTGVPVVSLDTTRGFEVEVGEDVATGVVLAWTVAGVVATGEADDAGWRTDEDEAAGAVVAGAWDEEEARTGGRRLLRPGTGREA